MADDHHDYKVGPAERTHFLFAQFVRRAPVMGCQPARPAVT
jgi:hypothetical protein